jgi:phospholipid transport system substrate-binding protein
MVVKMLSKTSLHTNIAFLILCLVPLFVSAEDNNPHTIIEKTTAEVLKALKEDKQEIKNNPNKVNDLVDEIILPICDVERMSKYILAKHWKSASIEQRNAFIIEFKQILIRNYGSHLAEYSNAKVTVMPNKIIEEKLYQTVSTKLDARIGSKPLLVDYVFRVTDGNSKVVDVRVEGMSILKTFRTAFTKEIAETSLVDLIERITLVNQPSLAMNNL